MATEVFSTEEITLLDGSSVELRPLPIGQMKKTMREWLLHTAEVQKKYSDFSKEQEAKVKAAKESDDEVELEDFDPLAYAIFQADLQEFQYNKLIELCKPALAGQLKGDRTEKQWTEYLHETLDDDTVSRILEKTAKLRIGNNADPNLTTPTAE